MPKNTLEDLRNHLFATLEGLTDEKKPMEIDRANAVVKVAQTIVNAAKTEIEFIEATGEEPATDFFGKREKPKLLPQSSKTNGRAALRA
jgi:hypothetical protein